MSPDRFTWDDAWIFYAIVCCSPPGGAPLREIIARADYFNHAIPEREALEDSLNRLAAAGLIEPRSRGRFRPAVSIPGPEVRERETATERIDSLLRSLRALPEKASLPVKITISPRMMREAVRQRGGGKR